MYRYLIMAAVIVTRQRYRNASRETERVIPTHILLFTRQQNIEHV